VIFIGPQSRTHKPISTDSIQAPPLCYYLQYRPPIKASDTKQQPEELPEGIHTSRPWVPENPIDLSRDTIDRVIQKLHGRTIVFFGPVDFARALNRIATRAEP